MQNWAETVTYSTVDIRRPRSLEELSAVVGSVERVKALGSRHSFNASADSTGVQVELSAMPRRITVDTDHRTVTCGAGMTHADLSDSLHRAGLALPNLASLPHISVGGAIQTGTHGSGVGNAALSASVESVGIVDASGTPRTVTRGDPDFPAVVVGLGAFGVVHSVTQRCVPAFQVAQAVYEDLPWERVLGSLELVMGAGYSVSLFTRYDAPTVPQVWVKRRPTDPSEADLRALGATLATRTLHPVPDTPSDNVTEQLGVPGPSHERLPHFRHDFRPGRGDEIQSEYLVDVQQGIEAVQALRAMGGTLAPLLHMAEIRRVAPDDAWISPAAGRDSLALHFTWRRLPRDVSDAVHLVEEALVPLGGRPHWGKLFHCDHATLRELYPHLRDFASAVDRWDPDDRFANAFLDRVLGRTTDPDRHHPRLPRRRRP